MKRREREEHDKHALESLRAKRRQFAWIAFYAIVLEVVMVCIGLSAVGEYDIRGWFFFYTHVFSLLPVQSLADYSPIMGTAAASVIQVFLYIGIAYVYKARSGKTRRQFARFATATDPRATGSPDALYLLACRHANNGEIAECKSIVGELLKSHPDYFERALQDKALHRLRRWLQYNRFAFTGHEQ